MSCLNWINLNSRRTNYRWRKIAFATGLLIFLLASFSAPVAVGQPSDPEPQRLVNIYSASDTTNFAVGDVHLDGRQIFALTAPVLNAKQQEAISLSPIQQRVQTVKNQLQEIAKTNFEAETLEVNYTLDSTSQLPIISVNGNYLMTVTTADARLYGVELTTHAQNLTKIIKNALVASQREHQPKFLAQQALRAGGAIISMLLLTLAIRLRQRHIKARYGAVLTQLEQLNASQKQLEDLSEQEQNEAAAHASQQQQEIARKQQIKFWYEVRQRLLQLGHIGVWGCGLTLCLSLFPQTRWLQSLLLKGLSLTLLKLILIGAATYLTLRISFVVIDHFVAALSQGRFLPDSASVRTIQRLQTFSGVMKGVSAFCCIGAGVLTALSILGVNILPLLASVSIFGVAISFGSQSLVKDMINGLFVLLEDQYGVGDVITANNESGAVEKMNLRVTQLRNQDGDLITIPNGSIAMVKNHTSSWSRVNLGINVAYDTNLDHAIAVIEKAAIEMSLDAQWQELILEPPKVLGVDAFGENSITIRLLIQTQPLKQWEVGREFRRRLKQVFDEEEISMPFPQRSIWFKNSLQEPSNGHHNSNFSQLLDGRHN
ncbi:mechanosensitive ion channel family protein [Tychonema sp. LEGE 07203]|uniref:mechanosensitive ion channel family protein n=1 Tax=Tychonema sp. LEGE 07203 TaxID=1828671 RepID=UPI00188112EF|nr:mechanosensitive ion channel family protein [Tychonema sp. LEGE 07203]MBE9097771.1 mechanosensitive ion channel family protein [Tychonema sp. LEGE 07203]